MSFFDFAFWLVRLLTDPAPVTFLLLLPLLPGPFEWESLKLLLLILSYENRSPIQLSSFLFSLLFSSAEWLYIPE